MAGRNGSSSEQWSTEIDDGSLLGTALTVSFLCLFVVRLAEMERRDILKLSGEKLRPPQVTLLAIPAAVSTINMP